MLNTVCGSPGPVSPSAASRTVVTTRFTRGARRACGVTRQVVVRSSYSACACGFGSAPRAQRTQQCVAGGVLAADELDHVDPVAVQPQQRGPERVGERVGEPLAQDAVAGQQAYGAGVGARRSWAAMSWWQQGAASTSRASQPTARARASSVAVSQAWSASTTSGAGSTTASAMPPCTKVASTPSSGRHRLAVGAGTAPWCRLRSGAPGCRGRSGTPARRRSGRRCRSPGRPRAAGRRGWGRGACRSSIAAVDGLVEQPQELLDLAVLRLPARLHTSGRRPRCRAPAAPGGPRAAAGAWCGRGCGRRRRGDPRGPPCAPPPPASWSPAAGGSRSWSRRASCRTARRAARRRRPARARPARGWR